MSAALQKTVNMDKARMHWSDPPDWIQVLAMECDRTSQVKAGTKIGYSNSVVNQALKGTYPSMDIVEQAVRGALMNATVDCPVMGQVPGDQCRRYQRQPFAATNPMRVKLYKACRSGCPHKRG